jgi:hypothetical protein
MDVALQIEPGAFIIESLAKPPEQVNRAERERIGVLLISLADCLLRCAPGAHAEKHFAQNDSKQRNSRSD